ncbi:hypothetical protein Tco_1443149, partial [Tanacetum coccineum]
MILVSVGCQKHGHLAARLGCAETKVATWDDLAFKLIILGWNMKHRILQNVDPWDGNKTRTRWGPDPQTRIDWGIPELTGDEDGDGESPNYETGDGDNINPRPRQKIPESPWGSPVLIGDGDGDVNRFPNGDGTGMGMRMRNGDGD